MRSQFPEVARTRTGAAPAGPARIPSRPTPTRARVPGVDPDRRTAGRGGTGRGTSSGRTATGSRGTTGGSPKSTTSRGASPVTGRARLDPAPARPARQARPTPHRGRSSRPPVSTRGHRVRRNRAVRVNVRRRTRIALVLMLTLLTAALGKLVWIQGVAADTLATRGQDQRATTITTPATRGSILDRDGNPLAFTIQGRAVAARPALLTDDPPLTAKDKPLKSTRAMRVVLTAAQKRERVADIVVAAVGRQVTRASVLAQLSSRKSYVYLARALLPAVADNIMSQLDTLWNSEDLPGPARNAVVTERQDIRQNPDPGLAAAVVGTTGWGGVGLSGIESKFGRVLTGTAGSRTIQVDSQGRAIPNTATDVADTVDGTDLTLTLDTDLQYTVQQMLADQVNRSKARSGCVVVRGVSDGQIYALSCYQPGKTPLQTGDPAVTTSFEPGSVNKVVTFAAALEKGLITPTTQFRVDGQITKGGHVVHDAWVHGPVTMTATGVLGKSSNVGTLMIADRVGPDAFAAMLGKFGLGRKTGIQLPGEDSGSFPPMSQWSGTSFANLPIGQGISMTLVQLASMYAAIANHGVLVSPTILAGTTSHGPIGADGQPVTEADARTGSPAGTGPTGAGSGVFTPAPAPASSRVMSTSTATTLLRMLAGPIQCGDRDHRGTACAAAITGYQVAGKTGTAQQIDPITKAYSDTEVNATFAGIVPADHPRYSIAIMLDQPVGGSEGGTTAAPLFHQIAASAMRSAGIAPSPAAPPSVDLYVPDAG